MLAMTPRNRKDNAMSTFDPLMDAFFAPVWSPFNELSRFADNGAMRWSKEDNSYEIELPGFDKKDVSVEVDDGYLIVEGNRKEKNGSCRTSSHVKESFYVGDVNAKDVHAKLADGVLTVTLPEPEPEPDTKVAIEGETGSTEPVDEPKETETDVDAEDVPVK